MKKVNQSKQKLLNYLDNFIDSDYFQDNIKETRKELGIPSDGFSLSEDNFQIVRNAYNEEALYNMGSWTLYEYYLPEEFKDRKWDVTKSMIKIRKKLPINNSIISAILTIYLFGNTKRYELLEEGADLCEIIDIKRELDKFCEIDTNGTVNIVRMSYRNYPVVLKLHPDISQRDLADYIKKNWSEIHRHLSDYKDKDSKMGKFKTRNVSKKKRNDFIYNNRELPRKQIKEMVEKEFNEVLDYEYIGKIISEERKRRKEV